MPSDASDAASSHAAPSGSPGGAAALTPPPRSRAARSLRWGCTFLLACLIGVIAFSPVTPTAPENTWVGRILADWHRAGGPEWVDYLFVEFCANIAMFVPVGAVAWWWRPSLPFAALTGLAASCLIESVQGLFLPGRVADPRDLLSNTLGALLGAGLCVVVVWWSARLRRRR